MVKLHARGGYFSRRERKYLAQIFAVLILVPQVAKLTRGILGFGHTHRQAPLGSNPCRPIDGWFPRLEGGRLKIGRMDMADCVPFQAPEGIVAQGG